MDVNAGEILLLQEVMTLLQHKKACLNTCAAVEFILTTG